MTESTNTPDALAGSTDDDDISFLDVLILLAKHKPIILGLPFAVAVVAAGYSLTLPIIYTADAKILASQQNQSGTAAMLAQLGGIAGLAGGGAAKSQNDVYVSMLKSRTVADNLVQRFGLMKSSDAKRPSAARDKLAGVTNISSGTDGIITIQVDDEDAKRAADLANAYVDELLKFTQVLAVTEASRRRLFFERQLDQVRDNLANAEAAARQALERGGLVNVDEQGRSVIENTARLRAQITVKRVQIDAMRTFAADGNPDLRLAQQELESMKRELAKMEGASGAKAATNGSNEQGAESLGLLRDVKYQQGIFDLLAKQYELAKIDEAKDSAVVQVMDKAVEPDHRSKPRRTRFVLLSTLVAGFVAILFAFARESVERAKNNPLQAERMATLKAYLVPRRKIEAEG